MIVDVENIGAIVTGGASGLGGATARKLAADGANVAIFDANEEIGRQTAAEIGGHFVLVDVAHEASVNAALDEAEAAFGVSRILVNCAGIAPAARIIGKDGTPHALDLYRKVVEVNLIGTFNVMSKFAARLIAADPIGEERGVIVNTASIAAYDGQIGGAAYTSSKAGVVGLTLCAARDLAQHHIRVMTIAPGIFQTPMMGTVPEAFQASLLQQVPFPNRLGDPHEFAQLVDAIVRNPMLNGEVIRLDAALRMPPR
jgi:NAD(P)-dependent dehydrogenase (short-subunit alcohol dehydrogenase family)